MSSECVTQDEVRRTAVGVTSAEAGAYAPTAYYKSRPRSPDPTPRPVAGPPLRRRSDRPSNDRAEVIRFLPALAERQLDPVVDHALQEPRAVRQAVAVGRRASRAPRARRDRLVPPLQRRRRPGRCTSARSARTSSFVSGSNTHDLVDAVAELRREPPLELAVDVRLHLVDRI